MHAGWKRCLALFMGVGALFLHTANPCQAEDKKQTKTEKVHKIEEVTVTAGKTEKLLRNIDMSLMVFDGSDLQDKEIHQVDQLVQIVPNVSYQKFDSHKTELNYRGIGGMTCMTMSWNTNLDGAIVPYAGIDSLLDVERVEVVRGGVGSLYGRNTHAGFINIITKNPSDVLSGNASLSYGSYNSSRLKAAIGGPINENWGFRFAGQFKNSDGYIENTYYDRDDTNDSKQYSGRAKLAYDSKAGLKAVLSLNGDTYRDGNDSFTNIGQGASNKTTNNLLGHNKGDFLAPILNVEKEFSNLKLNSITAFVDSKYDFNLDQDVTSKDIFIFDYIEKYHTFTQELRLTDARDDQAVNWMAGLFYMHEKADFATNFMFGQDAYIFQSMPGIFQKCDSTVTTDNLAAFGQMSWKFAKSWEIQGGLRLDYDQRKLDWKGTSGMPGLSFPAQNYDDKNDWLAFLPRVTLSYEVLENQKIYGAVFRGYKAGDYAANNPDFDVVKKSVDPEYTITYEAGYKALLADGKFEFNSSVFYVDWTKLQLSAVMDSKEVRQNAGDAHSYGLEADFKWHAATGLDFFGAFGWLNAEFDSYDEHPSGKDLAGKKIPNTPEYKLVLGGKYRHETGWFGATDLSLIGKKYMDERNLVEQDAYTLLNAKVGYETSNWAVYAFGRNLLDETYLVRAFDFGPDFYGRSGEARMVGLELTGYF